MFNKIESLGVFGLEGFGVTVECDTGGGLPQFDIVGLPDNAVKEAKDRVRSALKNLGYTYPVSRITVNLAPADKRKTGPVYDLPVLLAVLCASSQLPAPTAQMAFLGELSLEGSVRPVNGVLSMALAAQGAGITQLFVPQDNAAEAAVATALEIYPVKSARQVCDHLAGRARIAPFVPGNTPLPQEEDVPDFKDVRGQPEARRALEIAAAGGHNVLMVGPPGTGKSMLAKRLPGILPPLTREEAVETSRIYSVAGLLPGGTGLLHHRPFRAPHHSVSSAGLSGGGSVPRPGEVSLSHNGVLFLDELPEFHREALEVLRQPLEDGKITVARVAQSITYPCNIMLVAAMNPCPCGYFGHPTKSCRCSGYSIDRYLSRISGPLLSRIDLHVEVLPVEYEQLAQQEEGECTAAILSRVLSARQLQKERYAGTGVRCNAQLSPQLLRLHCRMTPGAEALFKAAFERMGLSARAYDRVLKVARTIADLDGSPLIDTPHVSEAVQYRTLDRKYWSSR